MFAQRDLWLLRLTKTLAQHHIPLEPPNVLILLEQMLSSLEYEFGAHLENGPAAGLLLHLFFCRMPERRQSIQVKGEACEYMERQFPDELAACLQAINKVNQRFALPLPEEEAYNLLGIFKNVDIFIDIGETFLALGP